MKFSISTDALTAELLAVIQREIDDGCPITRPEMAATAIRRWRSCQRRNKKNKDTSLAHRVQDLQKGLMAVFDPEGMDPPACYSHVSESLAEVLARASSTDTRRAL